MKRGRRTSTAAGRSSGELALRVGVACVCLSTLGCDRERHRDRDRPDAPITGSDPMPAAPRDLGPAIGFREVSHPALSAIRYQAGKEAGMNTILEIVGGGVACIDFDRDGSCDLFFSGGGTLDPGTRRVSGAPSTLLRGQPGLRWQDVTASAGVLLDDLYSHGVAGTDFNQDGFVDLLVYGYQGVRLLCNQGDGTFRDVTQDAGLDETSWTTAAAYGDLDGDGWPDLYLASYVNWDFDTHVVCPTPDGRPDVCSPNAFDGSPDQILRGSATGRFSKMSLEDPPAPGRGLGVIIARAAAETGPFAFVANDQSANFLFAGGPAGRLSEQGFLAGVAVDAAGNANGSMGIALLDFDGDRRFDLVVTNFEHEQIALYRNEGDTMFRHASRDVGLNTIDAAVVGFGVVAADWDGDGYEDLLLTSGHVQYHPDRGEIRQEPVLLRNLGGRAVRRERPSCGYFHRKSCGRGLALGDFNNDGSPDVVVTHLFEPPVVLQSVPDPDHDWLRLELVGTESPRDPVGAIATLFFEDGTTQSRQHVAGGSYLSQSQQELFFRWRGQSIRSLQIDWPSGRQSRHESLTPRTRTQIVEPK